MRFSQRIGKRPIKMLLQIESIDLDLKNRLWNSLLEDFFNELSDDSRHSNTAKTNICKLIWKEFFGNPIDKISKYTNGRIYPQGCIDHIRLWFYKAEWYDIYDLIEFITETTEINTTYFIESCNKALEKEVAGYRIVNNKIVQITSENEINEIEEAINYTDKWKSVNTHLSTALEYLADRNTPNYRNSIKESISSVESMCKIITNDDDTTLGKALNEIEKNITLHRALKSAFSSLYGYTSDAGGIRHSLLEDDIEIGFEDAKFILVSCSAFINYLKVKVNI
jgi:hypothetical protein